MMIDIFLLLLIHLPLLQHLQFSSDFSSSSNAPPSTSYRQQLFNGLLVLLLHLSSNFPRASMTMLTRIDCQRRSSHSTPQHPPPPPPGCSLFVSSPHLSNIELPIKIDQATNCPPPVLSRFPHPHFNTSNLKSYICTNMLMQN